MAASLLGWSLLLQGDLRKQMLTSIILVLYKGNITDFSGAVTELHNDMKVSPSINSKYDIKLQK